MKILHVISSIDKSNGGPSFGITELFEELSIQNDNEYMLFTLESKDPIKKDFLAPNCNLKFFKAPYFGFSRGLKAEIEKNNVSILHGHGLWQMATHQMAKHARKLNLPYLISPHGMLDTWSINHKKFKKKIALKLYQKADLQFATVIHATSIKEAHNIKEMGFTNPIALIPNGITIPVLQSKNKSEKKIALFLSRIVKNKGIEELLHAWSEIDDKHKLNWELIIVGDGHTDYINKIKTLKQNLNLNNVFFKGPLFGDEKLEILSHSNLFILPTYTENFGIAIAEALASEVPVITTNGTSWSEIETYNCGWFIDIGKEPLKLALIEALNKDKTELNNMGKNGRILISEKYSIQSVALKMIQLYDWILTKKNKPDFII